MFRKVVFLGMLFALIGCQPKPAPTITAVPADSPHVHVDPLPGLPSALAHSDYSVAVSGNNIVLENANGTAALYNDFAVTHGERVHFMIIDPSLTDYQHIHPSRNRTNDMAIYPVNFTPTAAGEYRLFADVTPRSDQIQRFLSTSFDVPGIPKAPHFQPLSLGKIQQTGTVGDLTMTTQLDQPLRAGQPSLLNITVTDNQGNLFREIEPLMQAFAHLIGFSEDREHILHAHPMGRDVTSDNARGGPNLMFHVTFPTPGFYRLFLQVRMQDHVYTLPLDARVGPSTDGASHDH